MWPRAESTASPREGFDETPPRRRDRSGRGLRRIPGRSGRDCRRAVKSSMSRERARCGSVALRPLGQARRVGVHCLLLLCYARGQLFVFLQVTQPSWREPNTLKDGVATEVKGLELMDFAAESEEMSGGGLQSEAEGARLSLESDQEKVRTEESGDGGAENGLTGMEKTGAGEEESRRRAEEMRIALTVVKQEVMDWSEMVEGTLNGQWVKQEEDGHEVKEEKPATLEVKQEMDSSLMVKEEKVEETEIKEEKVKVKEEVMDWLEVKEEKKDSLDIKREEVSLDQNIKKEEIMDEVYVKEEKYFPKEEMMDDTRVKEEPQVNPSVGSKRKLAMSR